jgi:hypothetical protein
LKVVVCIKYISGIQHVLMFYTIINSHTHVSGFEMFHGYGNMRVKMKGKENLKINGIK